MRSLLLFVPALFIACAQASAQSAPSPAIPVHGNTPGHTCTLVRTRRFIGRLSSPAMGDAIKVVTHAAVLRWAPPGTMLTMDFRADRVTVWVNEQHKISKIGCG